MSQRYALARLGATLEQLPELTDRLNAAGVQFERIRAEDELPAQAAAAAVFDRLYGDAALALGEAEEAGSPLKANELQALEEMLRRTERALESYRRTVDVEPPPRAPRPGGGGGAALLVGALLLGGVLWWSRDDT